MSEKKITKDTVVAEIPEINPAAVDVLWNMGMGCIHCIMANQETVEEAAAVHGFELEELLKALNDAQ
jgi:hybrid cluster-associated redox disulfide protein